MNHSATARICAGIPESNNTLFRLIQFNVGDPTVMLEIPTDDGMRSVLLLRDIEMINAFHRSTERSDNLYLPQDLWFAPQFPG